MGASEELANSIEKYRSQSCNVETSEASAGAAVGEEVVRILHVSDTHGLHRQVEQLYPMPEADILIITGDFTDSGELPEFADFNDWLGELKERYPHRLVIFGNHEYKHMRTCGESPESLLDPQRAKGLLPNATVLEHEVVEVMGLKIYGSAWCPWHPASAPGDRMPTNQCAKQLRALWQASQPAGAQQCEHRFDEIPAGVDVLLSHGSPWGIMDCCELRTLQWGGSRALLEAVLRARPLAHLFGHMHEQRGVWWHEEGEPFSGGIEYALGNGEPHPTWGPPAPEHPCALISCNAMKNHPKIDAAVGNPGSEGGRIAGPARLIVARRAGAGARWRFCCDAVAV